MVPYYIHSMVSFAFVCAAFRSFPNFKFLSKSIQHMRILNIRCDTHMKFNLRKDDETKAKMSCYRCLGGGVGVGGAAFLNV